MVHVRVALALVVILVVAARVDAQEAKGEVRGVVIEAETGEPLYRATVRLVDTEKGAYSDKSGTYSIRNVPAGRYTLKVTYAGFQERILDNVQVTGSVTKIDISMERKTDRTKIDVRGRRTAGTDEALLRQREQSANVSDGISKVTIAKLADPTGAEALSRIPGLTVREGRYAQIRGSSERYNNTQLNGMTIVSTDPGKRAFSFDLVPSNLLENSVVVKSFTPDLPGDFSGGLVQLQTIDFPDVSTIRFNIAGAYLNGTTFKTLSLGPRGSTDFLGIDDGLRALPSEFVDSVPLNRENVSPERRAQLAASLPNTFRVVPVKAAPGLSLGASWGDRFTVGEVSEIGVIAALSYRNGWESNVVQRFDSFLYQYSGTENSYSVLWGGLLNASYKIDGGNSISIRNLYNRTAEDNLSMVSGRLFTSDAENHSWVFQYLERSFRSTQVMGDHVFPGLDELRINWKGFFSTGRRDEPDLRRISYLRSWGDSSAPLMNTLSASLPNPYGTGRVYSELAEEAAGGSADATVMLEVMKIKVGALTENKNRDFSSRSFSYLLSNSARELATADLDTLFEPAHFGPDALTFTESTSLSDRYHGESHLKAGYAMVDIPLDFADQRIRLIGGARYEDSRVVITTADPNGGPLTVDYRTFDWLPSANVVYNAFEHTNLRLGWSRTLSRPDFREYARYNFYDYILDALTYGNPDLKRTQIQNYDIRFEYFPDVGELAAVSLFKKEFTDAIEEVGLNGFSPERTWANANGTNVGVEVEVRKRLGFIGPLFEPLSINVNATILDSKVKLDSTRLATQLQERPLQGQSPFILNINLFYDNDSTGTSVTLGYNRFGRRLSRVARTEQPDFYEEGRDRIDVTMSQRLFSDIDLRIAVRDLLSPDAVVTQFDGGTPARVDTREPSISIGLSIKR